MNNSWRLKFREVWDRGLSAWQSGRRTPQTLFPTDDAAFLASIGCTAQELFDFIDDHQLVGEPDFETALAVTAIRRDYFLHVLGGRPTGHVATRDSLPSKQADIEGIAWLPRIIAKARLKLRGEMPPDLMYGCGGDRPFLRQVNLTLPAFLQLVWNSGQDDHRIVEAVKAAVAHPDPQTPDNLQPAAPANTSPPGASQPAYNLPNR